MFPVAKLERLPLKTALKKTALIFRGWETRLLGGEALHADPATRPYLALLLEVLARRPLPPEVAAALHALSPTPALTSAETLLRSLNAARHAILSSLGAEAAEWDLLDSRTGGLDAAARRVLPIRVYLEDVRSPYNVGSILRTAEAFGVERVWLSAAVPLPTHRRAVRTARGAQDSVPWEKAELEAAARAGAVFALETEGTPLADFPFPSSGTVLVGSEELGLSPEALALADASLGRVSIPMSGAKRSLNVAVAFGILMQRWFSALG
ncbi:MAG: TrmH family RNA methyltransferase [Spirochaetales bacterium]|nr:TrmH family RNA methyltransferase [Spirochaetales bacterium]